MPMQMQMQMQRSMLISFCRMVILFTVALAAVNTVDVFCQLAAARLTMAYWFNVRARAAACSTIGAG